MRRFAVLALALGTLVSSWAQAPAPPPKDPPTAPSQGLPPLPAPGAEEPSGDVHRGSAYPGEAAFVQLEKITVVYPVGPGEPVVENRRSAELRGRWLASTFKTKVTVVADDQVSDDQRKGNLLLLGWSNRVFGSAGLERPFVHGADGTTFLGIQEPNPDVDLMVFHKNPLNWSSYIVFWSRIDPERDRFQIVPRLGSDWAMYRDFQPIRQGMFRPAHLWPPQRDLAAEAEHTAGELAAPGNRGTLDTAHYHISYDRTRTKDPEINEIAKSREAAYAKATAALGNPKEGFRIYLYVYENETVKRDATGVADPTHSVPANREIYMVQRYARSTSPHEEVHVLARTLYGPCLNSALYEGLALAVEGVWHGTDLDMHAALFRRAGKLPGPSALLDEVRFRALPDELSLPAAGALVTWLREAYGAPAFKRAYSWDDENIGTFAGYFGASEDAMSTAFSAWADAKVVALKSHLDFVDAEEEARGKQLVGDWAGMTAALTKALAAKPGDRQTMFNLASAQMRANDLAGAEATLKRLLEQQIPADEMRFVVYGHYQLGRVYDLAGRRRDAMAEYDKVLGLPDDHGSHELARERKSSPATKSQLE